MGIAFIGYVLPFGQMSFWDATVITNLLSPFPSLIEFVCGGYYCPGVPTFERLLMERLAERHKTQEPPAQAGVGTSGRTSG